MYIWNKHTNIGTYIHMRVEGTSWGKSKLRDQSWDMEYSWLTSIEVHLHNSYFNYNWQNKKILIDEINRWSLLEKFSCTASKLRLKPRRFKTFVEAFVCHFSLVFAPHVSHYFLTNFLKGDTGFYGWLIQLFQWHQLVLILDWMLSLQLYIIIFVCVCLLLIGA